MGSTYVLTYRQSRQVITFNSDGYPTSIADRNGNTTTIGYAGTGNPNSVVSAAGPTAARTATLSYSSSTYTLTASQTSGSSLRLVKWVKDSSSNLTSIVDAEGKTTSFGYTGQSLTTITGPTGAVVTIGYDSGTGRVLSVSQANTTAGSPGTSTTRFAYPSSTQTLLARPNTNQSSAVSAVPHVTYTVDGTSKLVTASTDEMGRQRAATYTPNGDTATATSGSGSTAGTTTGTYGANSGDSLTSLQAPGGATQSQAFANTAAATKYLASSSTDASGNSSTYTYNGAGNPLTSTDALSAVATLTYNSDGTVATALAPGNGTNKTVYGYNTDHQLTSLTPVTGSSLGSRAFTYDDFGRLRTATDGKGVTLTYSYDKQDRLLSTSFSDSTPTVTDTYTNTGLPATRVVGNGTTTYTYDQLGRLISRVNTFAGGTISYGYDKSSNLISQTDLRGTLTNAFDDSGTPTQITYPAAGGGTEVLGFATDDQNRRTDTWLDTNTAHTSWVAHTHQDYDTSGRVSRATAESRDSGGTVQTVMDISYCYNTATAAPICSTGTGTDRDKLQWQKDNLSGQVTAYTYDGAGRLKTANQSGGTSPTSYTYTYDSRGNRLTAVSTGGTASSQTLAYNAANQISTTGYTYDGTGNLTADPTGTNAYNGAEQMTSVTRGSSTYTYKYAGVSQTEVLQQQTSGSTYKLVYGRIGQTGAPVVEEALIGSVTAYVANDPVTGQPLMLQTSTGVVSLYAYDGTGNPTALLRNVTGPAYVYAYDPYGLPTITYNSGGNGITQNPFLFKGGIQDRVTGWIHYGTRWYNPTIGQWTQQDTLDAPLDPHNANRYAYAGGDPINNIDPLGALTGECIGQLLTGVGIAVGLTAGIALELAGIGIATGGTADIAVALLEGEAVSMEYGVAAFLIVKGASCT
mgnify:CR=1 FL=1